MERIVKIGKETYKLTQRDHKLTVSDLEVIPYEGYRVKLNGKPAFITASAQKPTWFNCGFTYLGMEFESSQPVVYVEVEPLGKRYELYGFTYDLNLHSILQYAVRTPNRFF